MKIDFDNSWKAAVGLLALSAGGSQAARDRDTHIPTSGSAARRLLQNPTAPASPAPPTPGAALTTVPAQGGMPPMLALGGVTTALAGFNLYPPDAASCGMAAADFDAALDYMQTSAGANAVRTWGFQTMNPGGNWNSLDHAVAATQARSMALVVPLANQWGDCEFMVDDMRQFKAMAWYQGGYKQVMPGDSISYRDYVQQFAARYAGHGHIHAQLLNEALAGDLIHPDYDDSDWQCVDEDFSASVLANFTSDMVGVIRQNAPNMLISLGTRGEARDCGIATDAHYQAIAALTDVCEMHSYDAPATVVARRLASCQAAGRPTLMGESAASASDGRQDASLRGVSFDASHSDQFQAQALIDRLTNYSTGGLAGTLLWHYTAPGADIDGFALPQGHPVYGMLGGVDKQALAASSANWQNFTAVVQQLTPKAPPPPVLSPPPPPAPPPPPTPGAAVVDPADPTAPRDFGYSEVYTTKVVSLTYGCVQDTAQRSIEIGQSMGSCYLTEKQSAQWSVFCKGEYYGGQDKTITVPFCPGMP